jgi:hypothetical protein
VTRLFGGAPSPVYEQEVIPPADETHMACMRGPCQHLWEITARYRQTASDVSVGIVRSCTAHGGDETLSDSNIFRCNRWWPRHLAFVPEVLRGPLRAKMTERFEAKLRAAGAPAWLVKLDNLDKPKAPKAPKAAMPQGD